METRYLTPDFAISTAIEPTDVAAIAGQFRMLINDRPDDEESGQPRSSEIGAAARAAGIEYRHIPVVPGRFADTDVAAFAQALASADGPVLAFCRSGMRAASLWALAEAPRLGSAAVLERAGSAGCDLRPLAGRLSAQRAP